jgi:hypothetical protein
MAYWSKVDLVTFNTSSGDFSNKIINVPPYTPDTAFQIQIRERSVVLLFPPQPGADPYLVSDSEEEAEWLTWGIVIAVIVTVIVAVIVGAVLFVKLKRRRKQASTELKARQEANSWQLPFM